MTNKKYILKPGKHQFAPKSPAVHDNETLSDEDAEWYLEKYPHIGSLFVQSPQLPVREVNLGILPATDDEPDQHQIIGEIKKVSVQS